MAYIQEQLSDEEKKKQQEQGTGAPVATQAGAPASGGTVAEGTAEKAPTGGGGGSRSFTDVRSFLEANRPQAQELAQKVGSNIQSEAQNVQKSIADTGSQYKSQIEQGATRTEPVKGLIQEAAMSPEAVLKRQQDVQKLGQVRNAQFTGPKALTGTADYAALQAKAAEAKRKATLGESQAGREELLAGLGGGKATAGGTMLDQLLLSGDPNARAALMEAGKSTEGLDTSLASTAGDVASFADQAAKETEATKNLFGETFGKAKTEFQSQLDTRLKQAQEQAQARAASAKESLGTGQYDAQALLDLGISKEDLGGILQAQKDLSADYGENINLSDYLQQSGPNISRSQVATQSDLAKQKALEELAGQQFGVIGNQVGGANLDVTDFAGQDATSGTKGTLSSRDRQLIDRYYEREGLNEKENKALQNALKREAEYVKTKTFAELPPEEPKAKPLLDTLTSSKDMSQIAEGLTKPILGQTGSDIVGGIAYGATLPTELLKKEIGLATNVINEGVKAVKDPKQALNTVYETLDKNPPIKAIVQTLNPVDQVKAVAEIAKNPVKAVTSVANKVSKTVSKVFCFVPGTKITMADGTKCLVEDIDLNMETESGGTVISIRRSSVDENVFDYKGVRVTGYHAVFENGNWIRVKDSTHAIPVAYRGVVWSVANNNHRLLVEGQIFADEIETDNYENLTIDESLGILNSNGSLMEVK
jgi:hypothetical protein